MAGFSKKYLLLSGLPPNAPRRDADNGEVDTESGLSCSAPQFSERRTAFAAESTAFEGEGISTPAPIILLDVCAMYVGGKFAMVTGTCTKPSKSPARVDIMAASREEQADV